MSEMFEVQDKRDQPFYIVDDVFLKRFGKVIGPNGIAVYNALCMHSNKKTGESWPSRESVHEVTGLSVRAISTSIKQLASLKLIKIVSTTGGPNHYFILPVPEKAEPMHHVQAPSPAPRARGTARLASPLAPVATPLAPRASEQEPLTITKNKKQKQEGKAADAAPPSKPVTFEEIQAVPTEARKPTQQQAEVAAWGEVMELDIHIPANANRVGNMLKGLRKSKDCPPVVEVARFRFGRTPPPDASWNFYSHTWQGERGQPPTEREINQYWGAWLKPALKVVNGSNGNARAAPMSRSDRNRQILDEAMAEALGQSPPTGGAIVEGRVIRGHAS